MDKIKVFETIGSFIEAYGWSLLILIGMGFLIALLCEAIIKKSCEWLAKKWEKNPKLLEILDAAKIIAIQLFCGAMSVWFGVILQKGMPLPGTKVLLPFWIGLIWGMQYFFSMIGIKGIQDWIDRIKARRKAKVSEPKPEKEILEPTEVKGVYKNKLGELVDKHGNTIQF